MKRMVRRSTFQGSTKWVYRSEIPEDAPSLLQPFKAEKESMICMAARVWHTSGHNVTKDIDRPLFFGYYTKSVLRQQVQVDSEVV